LSKQFKKMIDLFLTFVKIGIFTFGGGYAMIPLIENEVVTKKQWVKSEEVIDIFAVAQSAPGSIAINASTFIGYKIAKNKGAIIATIGVIVPSLLVIMVIAAFFSTFQDNPIVKAAFLGVRSCVVGLIAIAGIQIGKTAVKDRFTLVIAIIAFLLIIFINVPVVLVISIGGILGVILYVRKYKVIQLDLSKGDK
jgi:chromate transporter